ncbi:hypothetical protein CH63R_05736 [Colletotrichum higginsianum IMI 349063]|uniref:Uncharacterized protein n=1 Tax=Colletotrichum higginsianum (strain IMI 349063) TaxID=759273 RepID=A0A1B7YDP7_COLHI|nr:hypothetical protein CH63R_05736 [Colletotrichum higginsianum IMI 349063]OBR10044.1 hypothetical protein CH63R_05736 [Colletotrichum higginsianum IMI 349063]
MGRGRQQGMDEIIVPPLFVHLLLGAVDPRRRSIRGGNDRAWTVFGYKLPVNLARCDNDGAMPRAAQQMSKAGGGPGAEPGRSRALSRAVRRNGVEAVSKRGRTLKELRSVFRSSRSLCGTRFGWRTMEMSETTVVRTTVFVSVPDERGRILSIVSKPGGPKTPPQPQAKRGWAFDKQSTPTFRDAACCSCAIGP